jgi:hypothetical protein
MLRKATCLFFFSPANMTWIDNYKGRRIYPLPLTFVYWRGDIYYVVGNKAGNFLDDY